MPSKQSNLVNTKKSIPSIARFCGRLMVAMLTAALLVLLLAVQLEPSVESRSLKLDSDTPQELGNLLSNALGGVDEPYAPYGAAPTPSASGQRITLTAEELEAALNASFTLLLPNRQAVGGVRLAKDSLSVELSTPLFGSKKVGFWLDPYLNIAFTIRSAGVDSYPTIDQLRIGNLPVPYPFAVWVAEKIITGMPNEKMLTLFALHDELTRAFGSLELSPQQAVLQFNVDREVLDHLSWDLQRVTVPPEVFAISKIYGATLRDYLSRLPKERRAVALSEILPPLAAVAAERSRTGSSPQKENTALLFALSDHLVHASRSSVASYSPEIRLRRRQDLAQHVINSASIAATAGVSLAEIISTGKEAFDARYRSGFSFSDLTANRVGIKLAQLAVESEASALEFQSRVQKIRSDADLIPLVSSNRDGLSQREFEASYDDRTSVEYRRRVDSIDKEVAALPLFSATTK
jgi:hypothetical protein